MVWILIACLGRAIMFDMLDELIQYDELIKNKDHKDSNQVIMCIENRVELWSSNEEKMSTIILSFITYVYVSF